LPLNPNKDLFAPFSELASIAAFALAMLGVVAVTSAGRMGKEVLAARRGPPGAGRRHGRNPEAMLLA
jgi:hypothetical protein